MNINKSELEAVAVKPNQYPPEGVAEIAFAGRSNVGKSSLLNLLTGRKKLARVRGSPGKTRTINFYRVNDAFRIVDLPGYGYAKVSKEEKKKWSTMIETYLNSRPTLSQVILIVDSRHAPTENDAVMLNFIRAVCGRAVVVASKLDKLKNSERDDALRRVISTLRLCGDDIIIPFSAVTGEGADMFWDYVNTVIMGDSE